MFGAAVVEAIRAVYAADFDAFGHRDAIPPSVTGDRTYPPALLTSVGLLAERAERVGDLALLAQSYKDEIRELRARGKALAARNTALKAENRQLRRRGLGSAVRRAYRKLAR